jgi:hypothetical protein
MSAQAGALMSSTTACALPIMTARRGSGSSAHMPGPSATSSTNCSAAPDGSPASTRRSTASIPASASAMAALATGSPATTDVSGGSCATTLWKSSGRRAASPSAVEAPYELPTTCAGPMSSASMSAARSSSCRRRGMIPVLGPLRL